MLVSPSTIVCNAICSEMTLMMNIYKYLQAKRCIVRNRERLWRKYLLDHLWLAFKIERNKYNKMLKEVKEAFISADILSNGQDIKYLYNVVTNLSGVRKENLMPPAESDHLLAEEFADFFIEKINKIQEELDQYDLYEPIAAEAITARESYLPLSRLEVKKLVMEMKAKMNELDLLPAKFLKENIEKFIGLLANIVNISLESGVFAKEWKMALLHSLLKKVGCDAIKSNFQPVSNLSFISHLVEKAAIGSDSLWVMEQQQATILVIMDLSAAFDTVHHDILLSVLNRRFGFQGNILNWVETYLHPRNFKVCIGDAKSDFRQLRQSVPQGSVGGPILFNFYCSTITSVIKEESEIELGTFADDHNLRRTFKPSLLDKEKEALNAVEMSLDNIIEGMNMNCLKINPAKTELMYIASRWQIRKCVENSIRVCANMVEGSARVKLLGTWLNEHLSFEYHIVQKCKNAMLSVRCYQFCCGFFMHYHECSFLRLW